MGWYNLISFCFFEFLFFAPLKFFLTFYCFFLNFFCTTEVYLIFYCGKRCFLQYYWSTILTGHFWTRNIHGNFLNEGHFLLIFGDFLLLFKQKIFFSVFRQKTKEKFCQNFFYFFKRKFFLLFFKQNILISKGEKQLGYLWR